MFVNRISSELVQVLVSRLPPIVSFFVSSSSVRLTKYVRKFGTDRPAVFAAIPVALTIIQALTFLRLAFVEPI